MIECFMLLAALAVFLLVMLAMGWNTADVVRLVRRPKREPGDPSAPGDEPPVDTGYWREKYMREHPEVFGNWK